MNITQITTTCAGGKITQTSQAVPFTIEAEEKKHVELGAINIYPQVRYQTIEGFGGAMTEASAYVLSQLSPEVRKKALQDLFGPEGNHLRYIRASIDSSDFGLGQYQAVADPIADPDFATFTIARDRQYVIPMIKEAMAASDQELSVLLSPWSPPAQWKVDAHAKSNDEAVYSKSSIDPAKHFVSMRDCGGRLDPKYYSAWAAYITKYIQAYLDEGIPVTMVTIQNESIAATPWDSCIWTPEEQKEFTRDHLYPAMAAAGLTDKVGIYVWDHNKERVLEWAQIILDDETKNMIEGIAFHWYSGDHFEAVQMTHELFPDHKLMLSECCNGLNKEDEGLAKTAAHYAHDMIGDLNAGMNRWIEWNLILNSAGKPRYIVQGCAAGLLTLPGEAAKVEEKIPSAIGEITPPEMMPQDQDAYEKNMIWYTVGHFSRYLQNGAVRIGHSRCDENVEMTAAQNPDGSIAVILSNRAEEEQNYCIRMQGKLIRIVLPAGAVSTLVIEE